jgi:intracellular sulfur oxidation DsrE/DsrF family protein
LILAELVAKTSCSACDMTVRLSCDIVSSEAVDEIGLLAGALSAGVKVLVCGRAGKEDSSGRADEKIDWVTAVSLGGIEILSCGRSVEDVALPGRELPPNWLSNSLADADVIALDWLVAEEIG